MRIEISSASKFLVDLVRLNNTKTNLSDEQLERFRGNVSDILQRHYTNHWFPDKPFKGSGYRCIRINGKMDPLIARAGFMMGLAVSFLRSLFPTELTMWIDPREVSYRIGENGSICILYEVCEKKVVAKKVEDLPSAAPTEQKQQQQPAIISKTPEKSVPAPPSAPQQASSPPPALPQHQTPTQQQHQQQQQVHHHHHHQQQQQQQQQQAAAAAMQLSMFLMNKDNGLIKCKESLQRGFDSRSLQMDRLFVSS